MLQSATDKGELLVSLSYNNSLERLTIGVYEGRGSVSKIVVAIVTVSNKSYKDNNITAM
jgi:hypothetical protein